MRSTVVRQAEDDDIEVLQEALLGVGLAWAVAAGKGSRETLELLDAEKERARGVVAARREGRASPRG